MSVRSRRTRLAVLAATAVLGATIPVLGGATSAWACGDQPAASTPASAPASAPTADPKPVVGLLPRDTTKVTAGGAPVEFGVELYNGGTETIKGLQPFPTFSNDADGLNGTLHAEDLVLQVMQKGSWKTIALKPGCDPTLRGDYAFLATDLEPNRATRFMFRLSVTSHSTAAQKQIDVKVGVQQPYQNHLSEHPHFTLPIVHPAAPSTPAPTKTPSTPAATPSAPSTPAQTPGAKDAAGPAVLPAAVVESTTPSPASVPVGTENLASTGGGSSSTPMLIGGTTLVLLGAGAVVFAARRRAAHRG